MYSFLVVYLFLIGIVFVDIESIFFVFVEIKTWRTSRQRQSNPFVTTRNPPQPNKTVLTVNRIENFKQLYYPSPP